MHALQTFVEDQCHAFFGSIIPDFCQQVEKAYGSELTQLRELVEKQDEHIKNLTTKVSSLREQQAALANLRNLELSTPTKSPGAHDPRARRRKRTSNVSLSELTTFNKSNMVEANKGTR